jgi:outer membrane protein TolC
MLWFASYARADDLTEEGGDITAETLDPISQPAGPQTTTYMLEPTSSPKTLSLEDCIEQAMTKHARVSLSEEDLIAADAAEKQALAKVLPNLSALLVSTHTQGALPSENPPPGIGSDIGLKLSIPIFKGSELFSTRALRSVFLAKKQLHAHLKRSVELRTKELYHVALTTKRVLELKKLQVERAKALLESSKRRKLAGIHTALDLKRAEYSLLKANESLDVAGVSLEAALGNLGLFIGESVRFELVQVARPKPDDEINAQNRSHDDLFTFALKHRLDLKGQSYWIESAHLTHTGAWLSFAPSIDLDGEAHYGLSGVSPERRHLLTELNLTLRLPLFEGGERAERLRQSKAIWRREILRLDYMKRELRLALRGTMERLRSKESDIKVKKEAKELALAVYQSSLNRFKEGLSTTFELQDAAGTLTAAEIEEEQEWLDYALLRALLDYSLGEQSLLEKNLKSNL